MSQVNWRRQTDHKPTVWSLILSQRFSQSEGVGKISPGMVKYAYNRSSQLIGVIWFTVSLSQSVVVDPQMMLDKDNGCSADIAWNSDISTIYLNYLCMPNAYVTMHFSYVLCKCRNVAAVDLCCFSSSMQNYITQAKCKNMCRYITSDNTVKCCVSVEWLKVG